MSDPQPPAFETLRVGIEGTLGRLTLHQPDRLNPIGSAVLGELVEAAAWFDATGAAAVIVSGAGRAFSAGFDLRELSGPPADPTVRTPELGAAMAEAIAGMRAVTIAAVQGPCVGGGFVLALCCDLRVAADDAWFSLPEVELGIPLAWSGVPRLVREIGPARTTELVLTGRRVPAAEAFAMGLLNRVVAVGEQVPAAEELAGVVRSRRPEVVATTKRQVSDAAAALVPTDGEWAGTQHLVEALRALG
ncbi:MAG: enoyl-CoA hydratase/isomerase family protein [Acidimicrobiales bacterium]